MAMGECSAYSSLQADSKVMFAAWPASWRPLALTDCRPDDPKWTLAYGWRYRWQHYKHRCGCYYYYYYYTYICAGPRVPSYAIADGAGLPN